MLIKIQLVQNDGNVVLLHKYVLYLEERSHNFKKFSEPKIQSRNRSSLIPPFPHHHPTGI